MKEMRTIDLYAAHIMARLMRREKIAKPNFSGSADSFVAAVENDLPSIAKRAAMAAQALASAVCNLDGCRMYPDVDGTVRCERCKRMLYQQAGNTKESTNSVIADCVASPQGGSPLDALEHTLDKAMLERDFRRCTVCRGVDSTLPKHCPGVQMTARQRQMVQDGDIDFRWGQWVFCP